MADGSVKKYDGFEGFVTCNGVDYPFRHVDIATKGNPLLDEGQKVTFEIVRGKAKKIKPDNSLRQGGI